MKSYIKWLKKNNYSDNTIKTYSNVLSKYTEDFDDIRRLKSRILTYKNSPNTCILHYNVILCYLKWKNDKRINDFKTLKLPQVPIVYRNVFTKDYLYEKTTLNEEDSEELIRKKMTIRFLFETGIRASEINNIKKIHEKYLLIVGKGNKERSVFYNIKTFNLCYPFNHSIRTLRTWVKDILGDEFSPHSIRRSFATYMLSNGANPKMVQLQLGHSKIETTFSYLNLSLQDNEKIYSEYFK